jgi:cyclase
MRTKPAMLPRRRFLIGLAGGVLGGVVVPRVARAQAAGIIALTDRASLVTSGGTNVLAFAAPDGLVLVDSGAPDMRDALMASLRRLPGSDRVRTVFNTHWHLANTAANDALRERGASIVAHENTRLWMATPTWIPSEDRYRQPRPAAAHPTETFRVDGSLVAAGERIDYGYLIEAHTSSDIFVFFRDSNLIAAGDVASPARDPELDYFTGAWLGGRVDAMDRLLALCNDTTRIVPGHGPVMSRAELRSERDMLKTIYDRVVDRVRQGDYVEDMLKGGVLSGLPRSFSDPRRFLYDVHKGMWAHHNKLAPNVV